jgi:NADPH:quinone reductase-like Zn-dependent oxidoreductase
VKALRFAAHGGPEVLRVEEVPQPVPREGEILVRVRAAALNPKDVFLRAGRPRWLSLFGGPLPRGVGFDFAGERADGGEPVYGMLDGYRGRACAQWLAAPERWLAARPERLDVVETASLPLVALTALQALRDHGRLRTGGRVLVYGGSGGVGTAALQIARALGAAEVTSVSSAANLELCRSLGASVALDYRRDPLPPPGERFDVVLDTMGKLAIGPWRRVLTHGGTLVSTVPTPPTMLASGLTRLSSRRVRLVAVRPRRADLEQVTRWVAEEAVRPVIDSVFALDHAVAAFQRLESRRARGKVVLQVD